MIRKFWTPIIVALGFCWGTALPQSVDDLLSKHVQARGGVDKLNAVQAVRMTGKISMIPLNEMRKAAGPAQELPVTLMVKRPNRARLEMDSKGKKIIQGFDGGENAWGMRPDATEPDMLLWDEGGMGEMMGLFLEDLADLEGPLVNAKEKWRLVEMEGKEGSGDEAGLNLKLTPKEGFVRSAILDGKTFFLRQTTRGGSDFQLETAYADYRPMNGVQVPYSIEGRVDGELFVWIKIENAEPVSSLEDALFLVPAKKE